MYCTQKEILWWIILVASHENSYIQSMMEGLLCQLLIIWNAIILNDIKEI